jgi:putative nucleotidyltransferase with HDIG domain
MTEREFAVDVVRRLRGAGFQALWAGGCVRDQIIGITPKDYDVAADARPEQVQALFRRTVAVGASFGVVEVLGPPPLRVQVATFRSDVSYSDGRHPDAVVFASAREDALRRDFTINGMFYDPLEDQVIDYVGGQEDLKKRLLRAIGAPAERFAEDKLRLLRAVRFATQFELTFDPATESAVRAMANQISVVSAERIAEELRRLLVDSHRRRGMELFMDSGLAAAIIPELLEMKGVLQGPPDAPTGDLWEHVLRVINLLGSAPSFPLAMGALLHDIGKRRTMGRTPDRYTFYYHEHVGRSLANKICLRLKLSNAERERIEWLVEKHQFLCDARQMRKSKLKMILAHPGIRELLTLHRADARASGKSEDHVDFCEQKLREWSIKDLDPPPLITGDDLLRHGLEQGPHFKTLLDAVREAQLEGTIGTPEEAMAMVTRLQEEQKTSKTD